MLTLTPFVGDTSALINGVKTGELVFMYCWTGADGDRAAKVKGDLNQEVNYSNINKILLQMKTMKQMGDFVNAISVIDEAKDNPRPDT